MKRIVFDIETEQFTEAFRKAKSDRIRIKLAPQMRLACIFDEFRLIYRYFGPNEGNILIKVLQSADEIVSFNGKHFDLLVLRKHYGLTGRVPLRGKHIDLCEIMTARATFRVSLDMAAKLNLHERKHTGGRNMGALTLDELKIACRSDVCQTYQLLQKQLNGTLQVPAKTWSGRSVEVEKSYSNAPRRCPSCHAFNCLEEIEWDIGEMSDGQLSEYMTGMYGSSECRKCGDMIDWGF